MSDVRIGTLTQRMAARSKSHPYTNGKLNHFQMVSRNKRMLGLMVEWLATPVFVKEGSIMRSAATVSMTGV